jgi:hypothetical protein
MSPPLVLRVMLGSLLAVMAGFLFMREPAIDSMPRRPASKLTFWANVWEAATAHSHHPDYPAQIALQSERDHTARSRGV